QWLAKAFQDERYIRIEDKPLFLVYRASNIPDPRKTTSIWRDEARRMGVGEIYLCRVESLSDDRGDPTEIGFDAAVEFQPDWNNTEFKIYRIQRQGIIQRLANKLSRTKVDDSEYYQVWDYSSTIEKMLRRSNPHYKLFPGVVVSWDNTARRKNGATLSTGATPELYEKWLEAVLELTQKTGKQNFIFINAWNEWAEGNHLEPCHKWGRAYLEATRRAVISKL
ncbi:MAG: glycoside hydrolase family 99-like domain-containing protein, partial [Chroococcidiopsidaceae cyanobacterium CP_BM_RX_35]|nr:glycoside hydrolase family 99-like domain-containing protein [Chroococcidiopsidaceae cyanobacterium CP_BM_RX_35]